MTRHRADGGAAARVAIVAPVAARHPGGGGLRRLLRWGEQRGDAGVPEIANRRERSIEEARRLGSVELRIGSKTQPVDDAADQEFGLNDLEFALDRTEIERIDT